jgi:Flp pilus assembly protein TadG
MILSLSAKCDRALDVKATLSATYGRRRTAGVAVEVAILAPFLVALILGMCEMGRAMMVKDILTNAARKGCRTGISPTMGYSDIVADVNNVLSDNGISSAKATITIQVATYTGNSTTPSWASPATATSETFAPNALDQISVQVSVKASDVLWFSPYFLGDSFVEAETLYMVRQG